jgi:XTP/dITP diphosphohydrolase
MVSRMVAPVTVLASRNRGKVAEIAKLLGDSALTLMSIDEIAPGVELIEDGSTFEENALAKARQAAAATGLPSIADDSGLEVDALGARPGVHSARYAGLPSDDARNNAKLLESMRGVPEGERRRARFVCVAAYVDVASGIEIVRRGVCDGEIVTAPRGALGFGYDPLFLVAALGKTMAELTVDQKNQLSHRAAAFRALGQALSRG